MQEEIFIELPQRFVVEGKADMVYKLKKALYSLKQALLKDKFEDLRSKASLYKEKLKEEC